jgi:hypothetical protein
VHIDVGFVVYPKISAIILLLTIPSIYALAVVQIVPVQGEKTFPHCGSPDSVQIMF